MDNDTAVTNITVGDVDAFFTSTTKTRRRGTITKTAFELSCHITACGDNESELN